MHRWYQLKEHYLSVFFCYYNAQYYKGEIMSSSDVLKTIKDKDIEYVDLRFTDPRGKLQHVTMDAEMCEWEVWTRGVNERCEWEV